MDYESTHILREEIRQLRGTVKAFGIYFVVLTLVPVAILLMVAIIDPAPPVPPNGFDEVSKAIREISKATQEVHRSSVNMAEPIITQAQNQRIQDLTKQVQTLQYELEEQARLQSRNPRPRNNPTMSR